MHVSMTSSQPTIQKSQGCIDATMVETAPIVAVLVTRHYVDRVKDALFALPVEWKNLSAETPAIIRKRRAVLPSCRIVEMGEHTKRKSQEHCLLFIENNAMSLKDLHPMARQNIAWGVTLTCEFKGHDNMKELGKEILSALMSDGGFDLANDCLRVHAFPKSLSAAICQSLQQAAGGTCDDPFEGPIKMTMSASICTHVVIVVRHETGYAWNIEDQATHFVAQLNHNASDELLSEPTDARTGKNLSTSPVPDNVPVSRAYYKLLQVWDEILCKELMNLSDTIGVDLGASPGGWTQVLKQHIRLTKVVAIDPALLANRVLSLPGVVHVAGDMISDKATKAIESLETPISLLVCDACVISQAIFGNITKFLQRLDRKVWALPASFVITLKMPYKTPASLGRNIERSKTEIPPFLEKAASIMYSSEVRIRYQMVHLMANSERERTFIAVFDKP